MAPLDRSVLESKAVTELKEIAKTLDIKTTGLKKAQIVDAIAGSNGAKEKKEAAKAAPKSEGRNRETAPPRPDSGGGNGEGGGSVRDE
ncbi:MAG: Rho termination factor N-terminal domain-containing protein, partial [Actinomycetota bacterium]